MAAAQHRSTYRAIVRELNQASIYARAARPKSVSAHIRMVFEGRRGVNTNEQQFYHDMRNTATFMRSQRIHRALLERYNPLLGLSTEERVTKSANRVGLNMPVTPQGED
ncbi:hypothetical protein BC628DRAFT_1419718 [Trametes gibbosa]|nr:hypothetical protein BC628DRAFT_1419718 [Trametes gibbosa]